MGHLRRSAGQNDIRMLTRSCQITLRKCQGESILNGSDQSVMKISPQPTRFDVRIHAWKRGLHGRSSAGVRGETLPKNTAYFGSGPDEPGTVANSYVLVVDGEGPSSCPTRRSRDMMGPRTRDRRPFLPNENQALV